MSICIQLSEEIWHYHNTMTQTESTLSRKLHLRDMLYYAICPVFPSEYGRERGEGRGYGREVSAIYSIWIMTSLIAVCGLYVVGSSLNGFGNNSSDMDLCLMITNKDVSCCSYFYLFLF